MNEPGRSLLVTGANGFIGSAFAAHAAANGWRVVGAGRRRPAELPETMAWRAYDLTWPSLPPDLLDGIDAIVHAANARHGVSRDDFAINVKGSTLLSDAARDRGVERFAFLSSLAAHEDALSEYGKQKYAIQQLVEERGGLVIRPGLVLGSGGAFGAACEYLRGHRFVPLFAGGAQPLQTIYVGDLVEAIRLALEGGVRGTFTAAEAEPVRYRTFYETLCERLGTHVVFVPVPFFAAEMAIGAAAALRVPLPIDRDSLLGLRAMRADNGPRLPVAGLSQRGFKENIDLALGDPQLDERSP